MEKLPLDAELHAKLPSLNSRALIVDANGKIMGMFTPVALMRPPMSEEELQRRKNSTEKRLTTAELLASLEKR